MPASKIRLGILLGLLFLVGSGCGTSPPLVVEQTSWASGSKEVIAVAFANDGKTLASRDTSHVKIWNTSSGRELASFPTDGSSEGSLAFAPDGKTLATERAVVGAVVWDLATGQESVVYSFPVAKLGGSLPPTTRGWGLAYSPDGKVLAGGGSHDGTDGYLTLWNVATGEARELEPVVGPITTVAYTSDGKTIVSGSLGGGDLVFWDGTSGRKLRSIAANRSYLAPVCVSTDGRMVATSNEARWIKVWDPATSADLATLKGHLKAVLALAFSPDGKTLVSGDSGGTMFVWDLATRRMLTRVVSKDQTRILSLSFSPDGKTLASSGEDGRIHLWDMTALTTNPGR